MIAYTPRAFGPDEKRDLVSPISTAIDVGMLVTVLARVSHSRLSRRYPGRGNQWPILQRALQTRNRSIALSKGRMQVFHVDGYG